MDRSVVPPAGIEPAGYRFAEFRLDADGKLLRGEIALELPAEELALLRALLARSGEVVSLAELGYALGTVRGEAHASGHRLTTCLASLKERLQPAEYIERVDRRGYRIAAIAEPSGYARSSVLPVAGHSAFLHRL